LAALYHATGAYAKAEPLYQRALKILEKVLGPEHPMVARVLANLAINALDAGKKSDAVAIMIKAQRAEVTSLSNILSFASDPSDWRISQCAILTRCRPRSARGLT